MKTTKTICACMFYYTCSSMSKCTLPTRTLTEYKCKSTQPEGCSLSMCRWVDWRAMRKHHRDKELVSQLCVTFYWNRKSKEVNGTKKKKGERGRETRASGLVVKQWAVTWRQRWASPGHGCPPCQSNARWRREGSGWSACWAGGRRGDETEEETLK